MKNNKFQYILLIGLILAAVLTRWLPHPPNVSPVLAIALFSGAYLTNRIGLGSLAIIMLLSDYLMGFHILMPLTWGCFVIVFLLGKSLRTTGFSLQMVSRSLMGSTIFFIITNAGVFFSQALYPKTWTGLMNCYVAAIPFFRNALIGDLVYTIALFGVFALVSNSLRVPVKSV